MEPVLSTDRYASSFLEFRRMSDQSDNMKSWLKDELDAFMKNDSLKSDEECRILGIGSGVGEIDCFILANLRRKYHDIFARVLEPNAVEIDHFKEQVCSNNLFDIVNFDWRQEDALKYLNDAPDKRFHVIHLFHVLYYFNESVVDDVIQRCFNQLEEGGHLLIIQGSASNRVLSIRKTLYSELRLTGTLNSIFGEDILYKMEKLGYVYDSKDIRASLDVSSCLDLTSDSGNLLWDFITSVERFVENSPLMLVRKMRKMILAELSFVYNGRTYVGVDSTGISIHKTISPMTKQITSTRSENVPVPLSPNH